MGSSSRHKRKNKMVVLLMVLTMLYINDEITVHKTPPTPKDFVRPQVKFRMKVNMNITILTFTTNIKLIMRHFLYRWHMWPWLRYIIHRLKSITVGSKVYLPVFYILVIDIF
jgi:hypothetical protein